MLLELKPKFELNWNWLLCD